MPPPIKVHLADHNPLWATKARDESAVLTDIIGRNLVEIHHIGSTAIPGIKAKPIIDLMPVVRDMALLAAEYERVKVGCQSRHPDNSHEYGDCKGELIAKLEQDVLAFYE